MLKHIDNSKHLPLEDSSNNIATGNKIWQPLFLFFWLNIKYILEQKVYKLKVFFKWASDIVLDLPIYFKQLISCNS